MDVLKHRNFLLDSFLLVCAVAVVYGRLTGYNFQTHWDDNLYILNNSAAHGLSWEHILTAFDVRANRLEINQYNPLSILSFMMDYSFWGLNPGGFHLTNIIVHTLNGLLVYRLLLRLHGERLLALVAAAIFLFHPVQVESVAWISERKGLLSLFFLLISWECYCCYRDAEKSSGWLVYIISLSAFLLSLMAKSTGVVFPLILLIFDWCFEKKESRARLLDKVLFIIIAGAFSAIEIFSEKGEGGNLKGYHGGSPLATFYTMLPVFCRYLKLLIFPSGLNIEHLPPVYRSPEGIVVGAAIILTGLSAAGFLLIRNNRKMGFWVVFFWVGLLPVSQFIPLAQMMYEHYLYMPIIGPAALVGYGAVSLRDRLGKRYSNVLYFCLAVWLLALSVTSYHRTEAWKDTLTLFSDAATKSPGGFRVWQTLGEVQRYLGNNEASRISLERSLQLKQDSTDVLWTLAELYSERGEFEKADDYLKKLFKINPRYVMGWATLGNVYLAKGNYRQAKEMYNRALLLQPDALQVQVLLGKLAIIEKRYDEARIYFNTIEADNRKWKLAENAYQMLRTEALAGQVEVALMWLEKALYRGYQDYYALNTNMELATLWNSPRFAYLMQQYFPNEEKLR
jgi:tetratricopeptide (TPR) repeat protein